MGDPEHKRKRYCLMCNVFKPDRCHHCSACNRCVLNMDHHCPWINNCIGFWNRKFFVLLLVYGLLLIYIYILGATVAFIDTLFWHASVSYINVPINELINVGLIDVSYLFGLFLGVIITFFTRFHFRLVFRNISTLESLEKKTINFDSPYSLGSTENWFQVFGRNPALWPLPMFLGSGKPEGNGVSWKTKETKSLYDNSQSEDLGESHRESSIRSSYKKDQAASKKGGNELSATLKKNANVASSVNKPEKKPSQQDLSSSKGNIGVNKVEIHYDNASKKSDAIISAIKKGDNHQSGVQSSYNSANKEEKKKGGKSRPIVI